MYTFWLIICIVEIIGFVACANRKMRVEISLCPNDAKNPARFTGRLEQRAENKYVFNGILAIDRDMGIDSTLEVKKT